MMQNYRNNRILIVDDNEAIHADFRKILGGERAIQKDETASAQDAAFDSLRSRLFGSPQAPRSPALEFEMDSAYQGEEAVEKVRAALIESRPYAMAFVDMRMPPGIGGVETIEKIWKQDPNVQIVICTAYSDESWDDLQARFGRLDRLLILKKPFDVVEASQLACALTEKWHLTSQMLAHRDELEKAVESRTNELQVANEALLREIEQREAAEEKLRYDAFHDNLTGLPNRAHLLEQLRARITRFSAGGNNSTFALL
ncbi:MAG TPA: response regulator, partial [Phycisphaerae bacterium]|nr:response regulator [Phycisphaerae bacterium]